jgi:phosphoserine phosphatase
MDGQSSKLLVFANGWLVNADGSIPDTGRFNVQMHGKGTVVKMLQRRLGIPLERTVSIGDSSGDISMFEQSGFSINFNPWDERPKAHADLVIEEKDLMIVAREIQKRID